MSLDGDRSHQSILEGRLKRALKKGDRQRIAEIEADLFQPPLPSALTYIWKTYLRLRRRQAGGFAGPNPIGWGDIAAFIRCTGFRFSPWELDLIETLDDLYLGASLEKRAKPNEPGVTATASFADGQDVKTLMSTMAPRKRFVRTKEGKAVPYG